MNTTQAHIPIKEISDNIVLLKDGSGALILQVSAVNFGLLSEREQFGLIESFAQMLNSLSFSIQIVIYSKRLNISSYLVLLDKARQKQTNALLSKMMTEYRQFIQNLIKENEVLDKKFYVVIPLFKLELGLSSSKERLSQKIKTILLPRRDQVIRQLSRAGLKAQQLTGEKLLELFFDIYNGIAWEDTSSQISQSITLNNPQSQPPPGRETVASSQQPPQSSSDQPISQPSSSRTHPFIVEELEEGV